LNLDGEIRQEQIKVPARDIPDEGHDETGQKETTQGKLRDVLGSRNSAAQCKIAVIINVEESTEPVSSRHVKK